MWTLQVVQCCNIFNNVAPTLQLKTGHSYLSFCLWSHSLTTLQDQIGILMQCTRHPFNCFFPYEEVFFLTSFAVSKDHNCLHCVFGGSLCIFSHWLNDKHSRSILYIDLFVWTSYPENGRQFPTQSGFLIQLFSSVPNWSREFSDLPKLLWSGYWIKDGLEHHNDGLIIFSVKFYGCLI